jgi:hypothetical protein
MNKFDSPTVRIRRRHPLATSRLVEVFDRSAKTRRQRPQTLLRIHLERYPDKSSFISALCNVEIRGIIAAPKEDTVRCFMRDYQSEVLKERPNGCEVAMSVRRMADRSNHDVSNYYLV